MSATEPYCRYCGAKNEPTSRFCSNCGKPTSLSTAQERKTTTVSPASQPVGVVIVAALHILAGIGTFFLAAIGGEIGVILIPVGIAHFVVAYGLLRGRPWAWAFAVIFSIISIVLNLITIAILVILGLANIILDAIILYYLYRPHVKAYFGKTVHSSGRPSDVR